MRMQVALNEYIFLGIEKDEGLSLQGNSTTIGE